jgi:hypothetical protein
MLRPDYPSESLLGRHEIIARPYFCNKVITAESNPFRKSHLSTFIPQLHYNGNHLSKPYTSRILLVGTQKHPLIGFKKSSVTYLDNMGLADTLQTEAKHARVRILTVET